MSRHELWELKQMQSLPLEAKIQMTRTRIRGWIDEFGEDGVYVSFSGGKDSTVLLDIVRKDYPNIKAVFVNTGLEYPSVRLFAESKENVTVLRPTMNFRDVIIKYGYPVISKEIAQTIWEVQHSIKRGKTAPTYRMKKLNGEATDKDGNSIFTVRPVEGVNGRYVIARDKGLVVTTASSQKVNIEIDYSALKKLS